jgi:hypothetical protein
MSIQPGILCNLLVEGQLRRANAGFDFQLGRCLGATPLGGGWCSMRGYWRIYAPDGSDRHSGGDLENFSEGGDIIRNSLLLSPLPDCAECLFRRQSPGVGLNCAGRQQQAGG